MSGAPIMIMAGGTGGHVFPGLAVAEVLRARNRTVIWLGTQRGLESRLVPERGIEVEWISIAGVRGRGVLVALAAPFRLAQAVAQAIGALRRRRPAAVLGLGGFVAAPGGIAAWLLRTPLLIHEQNAVAGTTNRWLARIAARVFEAFPGSFPRGVPTQVVGNPIRPEIAALAEPAARFAARAGRPHLLVLGGSQGARILNRTVPAALRTLAPDQRPEVWHQAGAGLEEARAAYANAGVEARLDAFVGDMASAYDWADLVVARAGALTVAELAAAGVGAILVPFRYAIDDHQLKNARHFAANGAGIVILEQALSPESLAEALAGALADRTRLLAMAQAARSQAQLHAADRIAQACLDLAEGRS